MKKTVLITGASSGIGKGCAEVFAAAGYNLVICSRNAERIEEVGQEIIEKYDVDVLCFPLDVSKREDVYASIDELPIEFSDIDVLINNAGLARGLEKFQDNLESDWEEMIDTNVKGLLYVTKAVIPKMIERNTGHIINIGSIAANQAYPNGSVYCGSKAAVRFISDGLRMDIVDTNIKVTNIQPGMVDTNFSTVRFHGDKQRADDVYKGIDPLTGKDIGDLALYIAQTPKHVQICELTVTPTNQASGTVVSRKS